MWSDCSTVTCHDRKESAQSPFPVASVSQPGSECLWRKWRRWWRWETVHPVHSLVDFIISCCVQKFEASLWLKLVKKYWGICDFDVSAKIWRIGIFLWQFHIFLCFFHKLEISGYWIDLVDLGGLLDAVIICNIPAKSIIVLGLTLLCQNLLETCMSLNVLSGPYFSPFHCKFSLCELGTHLCAFISSTLI